MIRAILLSRFDARLGPVIVCSMPQLKENVIEDFGNIPRLMDNVENNEFLMHTYHNIYSANYYFEVPTERNRGNTESLMLSIVFRIQVDDRDWIGRITSFLEDQEPVLVKMAFKMKNDPSLRSNEGFASGSDTRLKQLLYEFYTEIFIQNAADLVADNVIHQNVWVMSPPGFDAVAVLDRIRHALWAPPQSLKKDLLHFLLSRLKFTEYNCELRQDDVQNCSVCKRRYIESAACMFVFNVDDGNARGELEDTIDHMASLDIGITNPFLVLGIEEGGHDDDQITTLIDVSHSFTGHNGVGVHASQAVVTIGDAETYNELIRWFLTVIM
jgi:hypothetical protein